MTIANASPAPRTAKKPRKISARYLENAAVHYLRRFASTSAQLRRVMLRKIDRSLRFHGGDRDQAITLLEEVVGKLTGAGYLDDGRFAQARATSLRASGRSARMISQKLRAKGVSAELTQAKVAAATAEVSELEAARIWARRKRLGQDESRRQKDLAALARAGFSYSVARSVLDELRGMTPR